jgi:hypothetical protein
MSMTIIDSFDGKTEAVINPAHVLYLGRNAPAQFVRKPLRRNA